jgi:hypothetical protein
MRWELELKRLYYALPANAKSSTSIVLIGALNLRVLSNTNLDFDSLHWFRLWLGETLEGKTGRQQNENCDHCEKTISLVLHLCSSILSLT